MTLTNVKSQLIGHFIDHSTFKFKDSLGDPSEEYKKIKIDDDLEEFKPQLLVQALNNLAKSEIISYIGDTNCGEVWILNQPLSQYYQNVSISNETAFYMAEILNEFYERNGEPQDIFANPLLITESDLGSILSIVDTFVLELEDDEGDEV